MAPLSKSRLRSITKYRKRMRAEGRCIVCGEPAINASHCEVHAEQHRERSRRHYHGTLRGTPRVHRCSNCGEPGHNSRTCEG